VLYHVERRQAPTNRPTAAMRCTLTLGTPRRADLADRETDQVPPACADVQC
jgi:hypothetical protein